MQRTVLVVLLQPSSCRLHFRRQAGAMTSRISGTHYLIDNFGCVFDSGAPDWQAWRCSRVATRSPLLQPDVESAGR